MVATQIRSWPREANRGPARLLTIAFLVILVPTVVRILIAPQYGTTVFSRAVVVGSVVLLGLAYLLRRPVCRAGAALDAHPRGARAVLAVAAGVLLVTGVGIALALQYPMGWDVQTVFQAATAAAHGRAVPDPGYFQIYPNNIPLFALEVAAIRVGAGLGLAPITAVLVLNATLIWLAVVLTWSVSRRLAGTVSALAATGIVVVFTTFGFWGFMPYTDPMVLPLPLLIVRAVLALRDSSSLGRILLWSAAIGVIGAVGARLKPQLLIGLVAVVVVVGGSAALSRRGRSAMATALLCVGFLALGAGAANVATTRVIDSAGLLAQSSADTSRALPAMSWVLMGLQEVSWIPENTWPGGYREETIAELLALPDPSLRSAWATEQVRERLVQLGPVGIADFASRKATWMLGDGTFWGWAKASPVTFARSDPLARAVQAVMGPSGGGFPYLANTSQALWLLVLLGSVAGAVGAASRPRGRRAGSERVCLDRAGLDRAILVMRLWILGWLAFQVCWEARSRFTYHLMPFFVILAVTGFGSLRHLLGAATRAGRGRGSGTADAVPLHLDPGRQVEHQRGAAMHDGGAR